MFLEKYTHSAYFMLSNQLLAAHNPDLFNFFGKFIEAEPQLSFMLFLAAGLGGVITFLPKSKAKLSTGFLAGTRELINANRVADDQIRRMATIQSLIRQGEYNPDLYDKSEDEGLKNISSVEHFTPELIRIYGARARQSKQSRGQKKLPSANRISLWCGTPRYWLNRKHPLHRQAVWLQTQLGCPPTTWLADCQRGIIALGPPNSGKTYTVVDSCIESAAAQSLPILLYAAKENHQARHFVMALKYGYEPPGIFAPGREEGGVINIVDGIRDADDVNMARVLAKALNRAMTRDQSGGGNEFFENAGDATIRGGLLICKMPEVMEQGMGDLGFLYALFSLDNLVGRLEYRRQRGGLSEWILAAIGQILSLADAEKTLQCILATCNYLFASVIQPSLVQAMTGKSTVSMDLYDPRKMLILRLDDDLSEVMGPVVAAVMELVIQKNLSLNLRRKLPLLVSLDEVFSGNPPLYLAGLPSWIAKYREQGGIFMLGAQDLTQPESVYGREVGPGMVAMMATHALFKAGNQTTADTYSRRYGEKDVVYWTQNRDGTGRVNRTQHIQKFPLITPDQLLTQPEGSMVLENPAYRTSMGRDARVGVPYQVAVKIPREEQRFREECDELYYERYKPWLLQQSRASMPSRDELVQRLKDRRALAEAMFPKPPENDESNSLAF
jgi:type IV secretion system protein VirD4